MKYNEELFNISKYLYDNTSRTEINEKIKELQNELLIILLNKFYDEVTKNEFKNNGILTLKIKSNSDGTVDDGFKQLSLLINLNEFAIFASKYCIYLGGIGSKGEVERDYLYDGYDSYFCIVNISYYEIIWDYKTYFETLSIIQPLKDSDSPDSIQNLLKSWEEFKQLPKDYQIKILEVFKNKVNECKREIKCEEIIKTCLTEGHQFDSWNKKTWMEKRPMVDYFEGVKPIDFECAKWERICKRCGFIETVDKEPEELVREREEQKRKERIKELEE